MHFFRFFKKISQNIFSGKIAVCTNCGLGEAINKPTKKKIIEYYSKFYWQNFRSQKKDDLINKSFFKNSRAIQQVDFINSFYDVDKQSEILEVGGGSCCTSLLLRHKYKDLNLSCCDSSFWKDYYEQNNIKFIDYLFPFKSKKKYDLIISSHQLEHADNIEEHIICFKSLLKLNGYLFIEVPNTPKIYWNKYIIDTPHLFFFTKKSLINVFKTQGFSLVKASTFGNTYQEILNKKDQNYNIERDDGAYLKAIFKNV